jgi:hypothetical protein
VAAAADLFHAVREAGKAAQAVLQGFGGEAERQRAGRRTGRVLRIVQAAQRASGICAKCSDRILPGKGMPVSSIDVACAGLFLNFLFLKEFDDRNQNQHARLR